jgi:hypothetical protein
MRRGQWTVQVVRPARGGRGWDVYLRKVETGHITIQTIMAETAEQAVARLRERFEIHPGKGLDR